VSLKRRLRTLAACLVLQVGTLLGSPMKVEDLEDLLRSLTLPRLAHTRPNEADAGGPGPDADRDVR